MMYYISSSSTDPYFNLALEQYVFDRLDRKHSYFMLWQNHNSIIIGKHQNTVAEINSEFVRQNGITVARRLSGGGAVYHDLGNLNFTFIADAGEGSTFDFSTFCRPVQKALASLGVEVEISGRNDMTIDGKKFSGNSQYIKQKRIMHHGTIMYDSDLSVVSQALNVSKDKIESKGIKSVRSRVTNIRPYMKNDMPISCFWNALRDYMFQEFYLQEYTITPKDIESINELKESVYSKWSWNYGSSPTYSMHRERRFEGFGKLEVFLDIGKEGVINDVKFFGDYFGNGDSEELAELLKGCHLEENELKKVLYGINLAHYFNNLDMDSFLSVLL